MGVKGLDSVIKTFAKESIIQKEFKNYNGTIQSIDASVNLYKFCIAIMNTENFKSPTGDIIGHLFACFYKSLSMLKYGIMPLWTFDGTPPSIKQSTLNDRRKIRESAAQKLTESENIDIKDKMKLEKRKFSVTSAQIREIKYLLKLMGLPFVESPGEAEAQCTAFEIAKVSNGVVTEDWDVILFGCKKMLKDFSNKSYVTEIDVNILMKLLGMNREQLIDFGTILGTDYCSGIGGLRPVDAFIKFKSCSFDIDTFIEMLNTENAYLNKYKYKIPRDFIEQLKISREYYLHAPVIDPKEIKVIWNKPDYAKLSSYLIENKKFNANITKLKINELEMMYKRYVSNNNNLITMSRIRKEQFENKYHNNYSNELQKSYDSYESYGSSEFDYVNCLLEIIQYKGHNTHNKNNHYNQRKQIMIAT